MAGQGIGRWVIETDRGAWSLRLCTALMASNKSPDRTQADMIGRLVEDYDDAMIEVERLTAELAEERAACAQLSAWAETVKGRGEGVEP